MKRQKSRVVLVGGLGSQLFGYAFSNYLEKVRKHSVLIDLSEIDRGLTKHGSTIESLVLEGDFVKAPNAFGYYSRKVRVGLASRLNQAFGARAAPNIYTATDVGWSSHHENHEPGTTFRGEFFTSKYFTALADQGEQFQFQLRNPSNFYSYNKSDLSGANILSVHVRRGDYRKVAEKFGLLDSGFYESAAEKLLDNGASWDQVLVFSDEPDSAKTVIWKTMLGQKATFVNPPEKTDPAESLGLMTLANSHIIANSSFSMWGALLAVRPAKVVAPDPWFRYGTPNELLPADWFKVASGFRD